MARYSGYPLPMHICTPGCIPVQLALCVYQKPANRLMLGMGCQLVACGHITWSEIVRSRPHRPGHGDANAHRTLNTAYCPAGHALTLNRVRARYAFTTSSQGRVCSLRVNQPQAWPVDWHKPYTLTAIQSQSRISPQCPMSRAQTHVRHTLCNALHA